MTMPKLTLRQRVRRNAEIRRLSHWRCQCCGVALSFAEIGQRVGVSRQVVAYTLRAYADHGRLREVA